MIMVKSGDNVFLGEYSHTIDSKGRIIIPAKLRNNLGNNFIITKGIDNCLFVYSEENFNNIIAKYKNLNDTKDKRIFMRLFLSSASRLEYDRQGRINIPISLIDYASLTKNCKIIGVDDHLEIWNKDVWDEFILNHSSDLSEITDNLFKN